jgi:hypothetical protein
MLQQDFGFDAQHSRQALQRTSNNLQSSIDWLISNPAPFRAPQPIAIVSQPQAPPAPSEDDELAMAIALSLQASSSDVPASSEAQPASTDSPAVPVPEASEAAPQASMEVTPAPVEPQAVVPVVAAPRSMNRPMHRAARRGPQYRFGQQNGLDALMSGILGPVLDMKHTSKEFLALEAQVDSACKEYKLMLQSVSEVILDLCFKVFGKHFSFSFLHFRLTAPRSLRQADLPHQRAHYSELHALNDFRFVLHHPHRL